MSNFTCSSGRRIASAYKGPAVLQTSREGGGEETGRLRRQMGHLQHPACAPLSLSAEVLLCP